MSRATRLLTATALGLTVLATTAPADAAALHATYDAAGTSTIASTGSVITLTKTTLSTDLNTDGTFTGSMPLNPSTASFAILGLLPVTATVSFVPTSPVTGRLSANPLPVVAATAHYRIVLSHVTVGGLPVPVGPSCGTADPVTIKVKTPAGKSFDIAKGGVVSGGYAIGQFANCGLTTPLLNLLIPGTGNRVRLVLSNGRFG